VISLVLPSTAVLARTTPVRCSAAVSTCRAAVSVVREPRSVLPSTAIALLDSGVAAGTCPASQDPIAAVSRSWSRACSSRRIIASDGRRLVSIPNRLAVCSGRSATHSAIAVYDRLPATTAHTAAVTTTVNRCRTPRRARGSGTPANACGSPDTACGRQASAGAVVNNGISDDGNAGMAHFGEINKA
jgi:hypothetical protein